VHAIAAGIAHGIVWQLARELSYRSVFYARHGCRVGNSCNSVKRAQMLQALPSDDEQQNTNSLKTFLQRRQEDGIEDARHSPQYAHSSRNMYNDVAVVQTETLQPSRALGRCKPFERRHSIGFDTDRLLRSCAPLLVARGRRRSPLRTRSRRKYRSRTRTRTWGSDCPPPASPCCAPRPPAL
jgi:hypothetical protein